MYFKHSNLKEILREVKLIFADTKSHSWFWWTKNTELGIFTFVKLLLK